MGGNTECVKYLYGLERQICEEIAKKAEEERLAAEAAAAAVKEARPPVGTVSETLDESNEGSTTESPSTKVVTLVEGPSAGWKVGPTGSILNLSMSSQTNSSKPGSKRPVKKLPSVI